MLARALRSILPRMTIDDAPAVTSAYSDGDALPSSVPTSGTALECDPIPSIRPTYCEVARL